MCLQKRHSLRTSASEDVREIWKNTSTRHVATDQIIETHDSATATSKFLKSEQQQLALDHVLSLQVQGALIKCVTDSIASKNIQAWAAAQRLIACPECPLIYLTLRVKHYFKCCPPRPTSRGGTGWRIHSVRCALAPSLKQTNMYYQIVAVLRLSAAILSATTTYCRCWCPG